VLESQASNGGSKVGGAYEQRALLLGSGAYIVVPSSSGSGPHPGSGINGASVITPTMLVGVGTSVMSGFGGNVGGLLLLSAVGGATGGPTQGSG